MKLIEAIKKIKEIDQQVNSVSQKLAENSADLEHHNPAYGSVEEQTKQIQAWLCQAHDLLELKENLKYRISKTNNATMVTITVGGKDITKSIAQWMTRRRETAIAEASVWTSLFQRPKMLRPESIECLDAAGNPAKKISNVRRYFNVKQADEKVQTFAQEPSMIDGKLEVVNAITELLD